MIPDNYKCDNQMEITDFIPNRNIIDTKKMYDESLLFKGYVDRYAKSRHITVEEALKQKLVEEVAKDYLKKEN